MQTTIAQKYYISRRSLERGDIVWSVKGEMREAAPVWENLVLRREVSSVYGSKTITITDEMENEA